VRYPISILQADKINKWTISSHPPPSSAILVVLATLIAILSSSFRFSSAILAFKQQFTPLLFFLRCNSNLFRSFEPNSDSLLILPLLCRNSSLFSSFEPDSNSLLILPLFRCNSSLFRSNSFSSFRFSSAILAFSTALIAIRSFSFYF